MELKECLKKLNAEQAIRFHAVCVRFQSKGGKWGERLMESERDLAQRCQNADAMARMVIDDRDKYRQAYEDKKAFGSRLYYAVLKDPKFREPLDRLINGEGTISVSMMDDGMSGRTRICVMMDLERGCR